MSSARAGGALFSSCLRPRFFRCVLVKPRGLVFNGGTNRMKTLAAFGCSLLLGEEKILPPLPGKPPLRLPLRLPPQPRLPDFPSARICPNSSRFLMPNANRFGGGEGILRVNLQHGATRQLLRGERGQCFLDPILCRLRHHCFMRQDGRTPGHPAGLQLNMRRDALAQRIHMRDDADELAA